MLCLTAKGSLGRKSILTKHAVHLATCASLTPTLNLTPLHVRCDVIDQILRNSSNAVKAAQCVWSNAQLTKCTIHSVFIFCWVCCVNENSPTQKILKRMFNFPLQYLKWNWQEWVTSCRIFSCVGWVLVISELRTGKMRSFNANFCCKL